MTDPATAVGVSAGWKLFVTGLFVVLNGFFVAAEFALVKVRVSRIRTLAKTGSRAASAVLTIIENMNLYLSSCQLGITISSLVLGWLAEPAVATLLLSGAASLGFEVGSTPWLHLAALALALAIITILHMTFGEQAPKIFALHRAEAMSLFVAFPLLWFTAVLRPLIWLINAISNALLRLVGVSGAHGHEEIHDIHELRAILRTASDAGRISGGQRVFGENVLGLVDLQVRHVMLPRVDVARLSTANSQDQNLAILGEGRHSRFPLGDPDLESVIGMVHGRDVIPALLRGGPIDFRALARPLPSVHDRLSLGRLIHELQERRTTCALVADEHGTTVGIAFLEDALEEIVGPIQDEFDHDAPLIKVLDDGSFEMAGTVPLPEAEGVLGIAAGREEDTIGGYVVSVLGHLPVEGERIEVPPYRVTVMQMSRRRVARLRFERRAPGDKDG